MVILSFSTQFLPLEFLNPLLFHCTILHDHTCNFLPQFYIMFILRFFSFFSLEGYSLNSSYCWNCSLHCLLRLYILFPESYIFLLLGLFHWFAKYVLLKSIPMKSLQQCFYYMFTCFDSLVGQRILILNSEFSYSKLRTSIIPC